MIISSVYLADMIVECLKNLDIIIQRYQANTAIHTTG